MVEVLNGELYQWDTGRKLSLDSVYTWVDIKTVFLREPLRVPPTDKTVKIPNIILTRSGKVDLYLVTVQTNGHQTIKHEEIRIIPRPKPIDYVYSDDDYYGWEAIREEVRADTYEAVGEYAETASDEADRAKEEADRAEEIAEEIGVSVTSAQTAATNANTAKTAAETAKTAAETAKAGAETAKAGAENALASAQTAATNAGTAKTAAEASASQASAYVLEAQSAKTAAETAKAGAETAKTDAETAKAGAETALASAQTAATSANTAKTAAETAKTNAQTSANSASQSAQQAANAKTALIQDIQNNYPTYAQVATELATQKQDIANIEKQFYTRVTQDAFDWEQGLINANGNNASSVTRIRTKTGILVEAGCVVTASTGFKFGIFIYENPDCTILTASVPVGSAVTTYTTAQKGYIRICLLKTSGAKIYPEDATGAFTVNGITKGSKEVELAFKPDKCWSFSGNVDRSIIDAEDRLAFMYANLDALMAEFPQQITRENLGNVPGSGSETLELRAYTFRPCQATWAKKLPKILFVSSIHGAEPNTLISTLHMADALVRQRETDPVIQMLMSNTQIILIPASCPYSVKYQGRCNGTTYTYNGNTYTGVNLNRNFNANWEQIWPASPTTSHTSSDYSGTGPESEPETQILAQFFRNNTDCLFAVNKHDNSNLCDVSSSGSETGCEDIALCSNNWLSDITILKRVFKPLEMMFRTKYPWLVTDLKSGLSYNPAGKILCEARTPASTTGTMDKYFSMLGIHGGIIEVAKYSGSAYNDDRHYNDMAKIHTEVNINYMASMLMASKEIYSDTEPVEEYEVATT